MCFLVLGLLILEWSISIVFKYNGQEYKFVDKVFLSGSGKVNSDPKNWCHQGTNVSPDAVPNYIYLIKYFLSLKDTIVKISLGGLWKDVLH